MASAMNGRPRMERRAGRRRSFYECAWLQSARVRHGPDVTVLNLSETGALVEARARLLPGAHVELQLVAPEWQASAAACVLRCHVAGVVPDHGVKYRAALRFDERIRLPGHVDEASGQESVTRRDWTSVSIGQSDVPGSCYPSSSEIGEHAGTNYPGRGTLARPTD